MTDALGRQIARNDSLCFCEQPLGGLLVVLHALEVELIVILVHGLVQRAVDVHQVHVHLHLSVVLGLRFLHTLRSHVLKRLVVVRLLLAYMRRFGRFD